MYRKGFTLIELLVVIAIIAILAAILFPVFSRVKSKAQQSSCISNMKQIGLAVLMYAHDWDNIVLGGNAPWGLIGQDGWTKNLYPYTQTADIFYCPAEDAANDNGGTDGARRIFTSYAPNTFYYTWIAAGDHWYAQPLDRTPYPSHCAIFFDSMPGPSDVYADRLYKADGVTCWLQFDEMPGNGWTYSDSTHWGPMSARHSGGTMDVLCLDGHVKSQVLQNWVGVTYGWGTFLNADGVYYLNDTTHSGQSGGQDRP